MSKIIVFTDAANRRLADDLYMHIESNHLKALADAELTIFMLNPSLPKAKSFGIGGNEIITTKEQPSNISIVDEFASQSQEIDMSMQSKLMQEEHADNIQNSGAMQPKQTSKAVKLAMWQQQLQSLCKCLNGQLIIVRQLGQLPAILTQILLDRTSKLGAIIRCSTIAEKESWYTPSGCQIPQHNNPFLQKNEFQAKINVVNRINQQWKLPYPENAIETPGKLDHLSLHHSIQRIKEQEYPFLRNLILEVDFNKKVIAIPHPEILGERFQLESESLQENLCENNAIVRFPVFQQTENGAAIYGLIELEQKSQSCNACLIIYPWNVFQLQKCLTQSSSSKELVLVMSQYLGSIPLYYFPYLQPWLQNLDLIKYVREWVTKKEKEIVSQSQLMANRRQICDSFKKENDEMAKILRRKHLEQITDCCHKLKTPSFAASFSSKSIKSIGASQYLCQSLLGQSINASAQQENVLSTECLMNLLPNSQRNNKSQLVSQMYESKDLMERECKNPFLEDREPLVVKEAIPCGNPFRLYERSKGRIVEYREDAMITPDAQKPSTTIIKWQKLQKLWKYSTESEQTEAYRINDQPYIADEAPPLSPDYQPSSPSSRNKLSDDGFDVQMLSQDIETRLSDPTQFSIQNTLPTSRHSTDDNLSQASHFKDNVSGDITLASTPQSDQYWKKNILQSASGLPQPSIDMSYRPIAHETEPVTMAAMDDSASIDSQFYLDCADFLQKLTIQTMNNAPDKDIDSYVNGFLETVIGQRQQELLKARIQEIKDFYREKIIVNLKFQD